MITAKRHGRCWWHRPKPVYFQTDRTLDNTNCTSSLYPELMNLQSSTEHATRDPLLRNWYLVYRGRTSRKTQRSKANQIRTVRTRQYGVDCRDHTTAGCSNNCLYMSICYIKIKCLFICQAVSKEPCLLANLAENVMILLFRLIISTAVLLTVTSPPRPPRPLTAPACDAHPR
jgi:hypothetical protein